MSSPSGDLRAVSEVEAGVKFPLAGQAREQVVVHFSQRRPGPGTGGPGFSAVTPSIHPEVPDRQFRATFARIGYQAINGPEEGVCGTAKSGVCNLDHLSVQWRMRGSYDTAWVTPGRGCLCADALDVEQQSDHQPIAPSGMEQLVCGAGAHSFCIHGAQ